jgi:hypothetical protein
MVKLSISFVLSLNSTTINKVTTRIIITIIIMDKN